MIDYVAPMVNEIDIHVERRLMYELEERKIKANRDYMKAFGLVVVFHLRLFDFSINLVYC